MRIILNDWHCPCLHPGHRAGGPVGCDRARMAFLFENMRSAANSCHCRQSRQELTALKIEIDNENHS
uniref:Uncharacterized protein n=1 Tax=Ralstonia syzygii R24 TaxID=907261 RepID=G3A8T5_9RALS|nr:hypothetical protein RALSY_mp10187 [Ralstonia syzygii R24]